MSLQEMPPELRAAELTKEPESDDTRQRMEFLKAKLESLTAELQQKELKAEAAWRAKRPVHNHGPEEGPGLACRESLIGDCLRFPAGPEQPAGVADYERMVRTARQHGIAMHLAAASPIRPDSWLNENRFADFRRRYSYAMTQSHAITALSKLSAEEAYHLWWILNHGGPDLPSLNPEERG